MVLKLTKLCIAKVGGQLLHEGLAQLLAEPSSARMESKSMYCIVTVFGLSI